MEARLLEEYRDLNKRIGILENFLTKESFKEIPEDQQVLLQEQLKIMVNYSGILSTRLLILIRK